LESSSSTAIGPTLDADESDGTVADVSDDASGLASAGAAAESIDIASGRAAGEPASCAVTRRK